MRQQISMDTVVSSLYDAVLDPSLWPQALRAGCRYLDSADTHVLAIDRRSRLLPFSMAGELPSESLQEFEQHYMHRCPRFVYAMDHPEKRVNWDYLHTSERAMDRDPAYVWRQRETGTRYYCSFRLDVDPFTTSHVAWMRSRRQGHVDAALLRRARPIARHLQRATTLARHLQGVDLRLQAAAEALERMPVAVLMLSATGRVLHANARAETVLRDADGLVVREGALHALRAGDDARLQELIHDAAAGERERGEGAGGRMALPRRSGKRPYALLVAPLTRRARLFLVEAPAVMVLLTDPEADLQPVASHLAAVHELTAREAALAARLVAGDSLAQAAAVLGITAGTARNHLAAVLRKTRTRRQSQLLRLLVASLPMTLR